MSDVTPEQYPKIDVHNGAVLIVDDDASIRRALRAFLAEGDLFSRFYEASNGLEAFKILANELHNVDLVLCDLEMPEFDGFKFLQMQSTREDFQSVPVIVVTSRDESEHRVRGLNLGAADYLTKPVQKEELRIRAYHQLRIRRLQEALRRAIRDLTQMSQTDPLTGLANRRAFMTRSEHEYARADRYKGKLALILLDIDDFKRVNDTYGHLAGDDVLRAVATVLTRGLRATDLAARYGGEEFAILLPETDQKSALRVAERYRSEVQKLSFKFDSKDVSITISLGVAALPENHTTGLEDFLRKADTALYAAKETGKNMTAVAP